MRVGTARQLLGLLEEQINAVRRDPTLSTVECARCIAALAGVMLRAIETADLEARLAALERVLGQRGRP